MGYEGSRSPRWWYVITGIPFVQYNAEILLIINSSLFPNKAISTGK